MRRVTIISEEWRPLKPLLQAYRKKGVAVRLIAAATPNHDALQAYGSEADALLLIGSRQRSPQTTAGAGALAKRWDGHTARMAAESRPGGAGHVCHNSRARSPS
jgi:hypothetical protein